ncbi:predicted protein [Arabidopsis lyrata subsp. lyrata]|uniref:Predicted protein n=1 Tax=Arabidopsis lyrata subsp. lyrata TaxID=81972 RepID=D7L1E2_ARALL|nr:predicted protein [Arabidopsis lyrata subsp. lyrata]
MKRKNLDVSGFSIRHGLPVAAFYKIHHSYIRVLVASHYEVFQSSLTLLNLLLDNLSHFLV